MRQVTATLNPTLNPTLGPGGTVLLPERAIVGEGTSEALWASAGTFELLPELDLDACPRAVVLAPHPDDETFGAGGMIASLLERGSETVVVCATDGEASHPNSTAVTPDELRARRTAESAAALGHLAGEAGGRIDVVRLHLPDGGLDGEEEAIADRLGELLKPGDWCLSTWDGDAHPDHEAAGRAARTASSSAGARLLTFPIWAWHWARPGDPRLPFARGRRLPLGPSARSRKRRAISCFESQLAPIGPAPADAAIVPPADLAHFERPFEVFFT